MPSTLTSPVTQQLYETDLAAPVEAFFSERLGPAWDFAHELVLRNAGPDIVAARRGPDFARRVSEGPAPATDELTLRMLEVLVDGATDQELRAWAPWGWQDLRRRAFVPALEQGAIGFDGSKWSSRPLGCPYDEVVAIELKLRDWRKGLRQARRNRAFAEESWLALAHMADGVAVLAAQLGVGVVQVSGEAVEVVVEAERRTPAAPRETRLTAEQVLERTLEELTPGRKKLRPLAGSPRGRKLAVAG